MVAVQLHGGRVRVGAGVGVRGVVEVAERHVLRHVGRRALLRLGRLLVAGLHELYDAVRRLHVRHYRCFSLQFRDNISVNPKPNVIIYLYAIILFSK